MEFVHLHCHSHYSKGWGLPSPEEIVSRAKEMGLNSITLTDINGLYGIFPFLEAAEEQNIRPFVGGELRHNGLRVLVLIKDEEGYKNLCSLISSLHCDSGFQLIPSLIKRGRGLLFISDMPECLLPLKEHYPESIFFEVSLGHFPHRAYQTSKGMGIPPVATSRVCMLDPSDYEIHRILRAISLNKKPDRLLLEEVAGPRDYLEEPLSLKEALSFCEEALDNTVKVASMLHSSWNFLLTLPKMEGLSD
ncbi:MAG: PHP domain-containing protein, partial [Desulfatiglandales bacterium]